MGTGCLFVILGFLFCVSGFAVPPLGLAGVIMIFIGWANIVPYLAGPPKK